MAKVLVLATTICIGLSASPPSSRTPATPGDERVEAPLIRETVDKLGSILVRDYFDPELAVRVSIALQKRFLEGRYQEVRSPDLLAKALTDDLYAWTKDKHLVVSPVRPVQPSGSAPDKTSREVEAQRSNFGIQRIEILPGNIGYLNLTAFYRPSEAREALASAMALLRHTDALIVDLRDNSGGSSSTVALFASYFFDAPGLELFEIALRPPAGSTKFLTEAAALSDRNQQRPTYILTSGNTWSGGEGFAAILQDRHRAVVVGQRTAGAGNQARSIPLNARFEVTVSNGQARTAVGKQTWEGTGVTPDIFAPAQDALRTAQIRALRTLLTSHLQGEWNAHMEEQLGRLESLPKP